MEHNLDTIEWPTTAGVLANLLGYHDRRSVQRAIQQGRLEARQPGGPKTAYLINRDAVEHALSLGKLAPGRRGRPVKTEKATEK